MGWLDSIMQRTPKQISNEKVQVQFLRIEDITSVYSQNTDGMILVKRRLTQKDVNWILQHNKMDSVYTELPESLSDFDLIRSIVSNLPVTVLKSIGLNFIYYNSTLLVFSDETEVLPNTPNVLRLYPVTLEKYGEIIQTEGPEPETGRTDGEEGLSVPGNGDNKGEEPPEQPGTEENQEVVLVRKALDEFFKEQFTLLSVTLTGTNFMEQTVKLTDFYTKHGIAGGRLKGSWVLLNSADLMIGQDSRAASMAVDAIRDRYTVSVPHQGRILRKKDIDCMKKEIMEIESEIKLWLKGESPDRLKALKVKTAFLPEKALANSKAELINYLNGLVYTGPRRYQKEVELFADREYAKRADFSSKVKTVFSYKVFDEMQWKDPSFTETMYMKALDNKDFFGNDFIALLERYLDLLKC